MVSAGASVVSAGASVVAVASGAAVVGGDGTPSVDRPRASSSAACAARVPLPYQPSAVTPRSS